MEKLILFRDEKGRIVGGTVLDAKGNVSPNPDRVGMSPERAICVLVDYVTESTEQGTFSYDCYEYHTI